MKTFTIVAIDGAAASGKTTTSRALATKYGLMCVSTGEHYRAVTHELLRLGIAPKDELAVERALENIEIGTKVAGNRSTLTIAGREFGDGELRSAEINGKVAQFAHVAQIRQFLLDYQRNQVSIARERGFFGLVMEGRDVTSVVLPDADLRFFLHADMGERERRRNRSGEADPIAKRDSADECVTLCQGGVIRIDTGFHDLQSVIGIISAYVEKL